MSSPQNELRPDDNKVVELTGRGDPRTERVGELLGAVRALTLKRSHDLASTLLDNVDDALFDLAEKAESNAAQTQFFDGMREIRKRRPLLERLFGEQVARNFNEFASGQPRAPRSGAAVASRTGELSLVDDRELEESLAIASMVSKADGRLNSPLHALNQRLGVICGGHKIEDATNPLGPASLAHAFRTALREIDVDIKVRLIVLKLFERYLLNGLDALYHDVNLQLMQAGVLPHLRHVIARAPSSGSESAKDATPAEAGATAATSAASGSTLAGESAGLHAELMHTLTALLASRRQQGRTFEVPAGAAGGGPTIASLTPAELLGALTLLQGETAPLPAQPVVVDQGAAVSMVQRLKDELMTQIQRLSGQAHAHVSGADEDTIDLVGMLFEYILQDRTIPAQMQVLLSRLQIPYLKVAILDRRMFAHASHPARKLLDLLADTAKGWSEESDRDHRLYDKTKEVVEALLADFDDDVSVFARQLEDFEAFVENNRRRADLAEQRAAEAARGRERLQEARRRAAREIVTRIEGRPLPALLQSVLTRPWANYLVLVLLRQGELSPEFTSALRFVDDFVDSAQTPADEGARAKLRDMLPSLEKTLRHGLTTVAFQEPDLRRLLDDLQEFWRRQLGEEPASAQTAAAEVVTEPLPIPAHVETILDEDVTEAPPAVEAGVSVNDLESVQAVRALKVGAWIEFVDEAGASERAKLSWISPISGKLLFVNRRGLKVADRSLQQLAAEIRDGRAIVLEEVPLFDRALDAIVERLRQAQAERQGA
ncbi:MAG TPA: DUF1631 domain-containing protein [Rhodanobacteraceae bacterium]|nr:DUF1631 domain-containing protein [Rhodanobacteraceae bacterium]